MENDDLEFDNAGLECHTHDDHDHEHDHAHDHEHDHGKPWIDLKMKRYDVQGQINAPFAGIDKIRASMGKVDYHHDEIDGGEKTSFLIIKPMCGVWKPSHTPIHTPMGKFSGVFGVGYLTSKTADLCHLVMKMAINKTLKTSCTIIQPKQAVCFGLKNTNPMTS